MPAEKEREKDREQKQAAETREQKGGTRTEGLPRLPGGAGSDDTLPLLGPLVFSRDYSLSLIDRQPRPILCVFRRSCPVL